MTIPTLHRRTYSLRTPRNCSFRRSARERTVVTKGEMMAKIGVKMSISVSVPATSDYSEGIDECQGENLLDASFFLLLLFPLLQLLPGCMGSRCNPFAQAYALGLIEPLRTCLRPYALTYVLRVCSSCICRFDFFTTPPSFSLRRKQSSRQVDTHKKKVCLLLLQMDKRLLRVNATFFLLLVLPWCFLFRQLRQW